MSEFTEHPIAALPEHQRCLKTGDGRHVLVSIFRSAQHNPTVAGAMATAHVGLKVHAQLVNQAGEPLLFDAGNGVQIPCEARKVFVLDAAALESGAESIEGQIAKATEEQAQEAINLHAAIAGWKWLHRIPVSAD